jgi:hypothetical protein
MIRPPDTPHRQTEILVWAQQVTRYLRSLAPISTPTIRVEHKDNGTEHHAASLPRSADPRNHPFRISTAVLEDSIAVTLTRGTVHVAGGSPVNPMVPKIWNSSALVSLNDGPVLSLPKITGLHQVYLQAEFTFGLFTRQIRVRSADPGDGMPADVQPDPAYLAETESLTEEPDEDAGLAHLELGLVLVSFVDPVWSAVVIAGQVDKNLSLATTAYGTNLWA